MNQEQNNKIINKVLSFIFSILTIIILIISVYFVVCRSQGKIAFIGDYAFIRVISSSMEPTILTNDFIKVKKISGNDINNIKVGDVIVFYSRDPSIYGKLNTHRVQRIEENDNKVIYITKGDHNHVIDSAFVYQQDVVALYVDRSLFLTKISSVIYGNYIFLIMVFIPIGILIFKSIYNLIKKH